MPVEKQSHPRFLAELLCASTVQEIASSEIARANLLCAEGLPGGEDLNIDRCLSILEKWAGQVERYEKDCRADYQANPDAFERDRGLFRFLCMVTALKHPRGIGIEYEPTAVGEFDFSDSRDDLLHGLLLRRRGTCTSLPVLFVAIGQRLGWPMSLAIAKRHVFCQWMYPDGSHRNLEGSCPGGGSSFPDDYYKTWPEPLSAEELNSGRYLRPLTTAETLALFLETRGHCLADNGRFAEAEEAYMSAHRFAPGWSQTKGHLQSLQLLESNAMSKT